jgi:hypothetical protein
MTELNPFYYVNVGPEGTFRRSGQRQTTPGQVDELVGYLEESGVERLAIHFHGGLIGEGEGLKIAAKMSPLYLETGGHPLNVVWETGLWETVRRNLATIHQTELARKLVELVLRQVTQYWLGELGGRGVGLGLSPKEIEAELAKDDPFRQYDAQSMVEAGGRGGPAGLEAARGQIEAELEEDLTADTELERLLAEEAPRTGLLDRQRLGPVIPEGARGADWLALAKILAAVVYRTLKRRLDGLDHGLYPTVMEELLRELYLADLGAWVWGGMKRAAEAMWRPNVGPVTEESHLGSYLLEKLAGLQGRRSGLAIDLIGHSAGSIAICRMLAAAAERHPALRFRHIVLLAPACTMSLFHDEIVAHPERYRSFRMFTMRDELESRDMLVPGVYTRSLLYFVSGVLEERPALPLAGLARCLSGRAPYDEPALLAGREFLYAAEQARLVLAKSEAGALAGLQCQAISHGGFDDDELTRGSLRFILTG